MNPIKAHILDRLRPKDRTMTTMTDEEATVLGSRAVNAGLARDALVAVGRAFESRRSVKLEVDGYWSLEAYAAAPGFTHRVPVRVQK